MLVKALKVGIYNLIGSKREVSHLASSIWSSKNSAPVLKKALKLSNLTQKQQQDIKINYIEVFKGIFIFSHEYRVKMIDTPIKLFNHNLRLDYCYSGEVNYDTAYNQHSFFEPDFFKIDSRAIQNQKMSFPKHHYQGITINIDGITINIDLDHFDSKINDLADGQIDFKLIVKNYCQDYPFTVIKIPFISHLFLDLRIPDLTNNLSFLQLKIIELLLYLSNPRIAQQNLQRYRNYFSPSRHDSIRNIHDYLIQHYSQPLTLPQLSQRFRLSLTVMKRDYHYFYGISIYADLKQIRLTAAKAFLSNTCYPVNQIAERVGYQNAGKFSQAFKQSFKITPTKFRQNCIKERI